MLAVIYIFIAKIGAESVAAIGMQDTGAPVLAGSAKILFGNLGAVILAVIVLLACLSTAVGLITCCAAYFQRLFKHRISYLTWVTIFTLASFLVGMFGLKTIIVATIPVLMFIYPLIVALIALIFLDKYFESRQCVYVWTMAFTFVMAFVNGLETASMFPASLEEILRAYVPLHSLGLGWIVFAVAGFVMGLVWKSAVPAKVKAAA